MRLSEPTDFQILDALNNGKRNTAANLSHILDKDRSYINARLPILADYDLLDRVGPAPKSGVYEITDRGRAVLEIRRASTEVDVDFEAKLEERVKA